MNFVPGLVWLFRQGAGSTTARTAAPPPPLLLQPPVLPPQDAPGRELTAPANGPNAPWSQGIWM